MRRRPLAAMLVLLSAALVLGGNALLDAGWGSALRSCVSSRGFEQKEHRKLSSRSIGSAHAF